VQTTLATGISSTATTMTVASGTASTLLGGASLTAGNVDQFTIAIDPDTINEEIVFVTGVASDTLTIVRGRAGTSNITHSGGATVKHVLTSDDLNFYTTGVDASVPKSAYSSKGSIVVGTGTSTYGTQTVGTNGQVLTANSAQTNGVEWTNAAAGDVTLAGAQTLTNKNLTSGTNTFPTSLATLTGTQTLTNKTIDFNSNTITNIPPSSQVLLSTTTLSGSSTTISSISSAYNELHIYVYGVTNSIATTLNLSTTSGTSFNFLTSWMAASTSTTPSGKGDTFYGAGMPLTLVSNTKATTNVNNFVIKISNYGGSTTGFAGKYAPFTYEGFYEQSASSAHILLHGAGTIDTGTTTINSIGFTLTSGTFSGGTVKIYGVK
jgi:hypothetical protein